MRHRPRFALAFAAAAVLAIVAAARARVAAAAEGGRSAVIVLLGGAGDSPELVAVLTELLQRQDVGVRFERQEKLDTGELLAGKSDRAVRTFVELRGSREAALYFRGPKARRYMLRRLELRDGPRRGRPRVDRPGRGIVHRLVAALLGRDDPLRDARRAGPRSRRAGARRAPAEQPAAEQPAGGQRAARRPAPARPAPSVGSPPSDAKLASSAPPAHIVAASRQPDRRGGRWNGWVGARYTYAWGGPDLGAGHGPGIELGLQRQGATRLGARLSAERWFTQAVPTTYVDTDLQISPVCLLLDVGLPLSPTRSLSVGVGGGADITRVTPGMVYDPAVAPTAPHWNVAPIARGELRYEMGGSTWRLAAVLLADVSLYDTHYDVDRGGTTERAATPWRIRPGGAVILGWRPTWGEK